MNDRELRALKKDIQDCNTTAQVDVVIKEHGLSDIEGLPQHIKELYEKGEIDKLKTSDINGFIQTQNYTNIANQAHGFKGVKQAIKEYNNSLKKYDDGTTKATSDTKKFIDILSTNNSKLADCMTKANGSSINIGSYAKSLATATVKTFALEAATLALNAAMSFGVSIIITGLITAIDNLIHREERLAEAAEEASENIKNIKSSFDNLKKTTSEITTEFAELSQHVDQITGKNKDLSTEQYERFLELSNQLAESLPNIGYTIDENGNKIVGLTGSIDEITQSINNLIDAERLLSHNEIDENMDDVFDKALKDLQTYSGELDNIKSNSSKFMTDTKEMVTNLLNGESLKFDLNNATNSKLFSDLQDLFDDVDLKLNTELGGKISLDHTAEWAELSNEEIKQLEAGADRITHKYSEMSGELSKNMSDVKNNIQNTLNGLSSYLNSWVTTSFDYNTIIQAYGSDLGTAIQQSINSINWAEIDGVDNWDDAKQWIEKNILAPLKDVKNSDIREAYIELFTNADIPIDSAISYLEKIEQYYKDNGLEIPVVFTEKKEEIEDVKNRFDKKNSSFTSGNTKELQKFFKDNSIDEESEYEKWLNITEGITDATKAMEAWVRANEDTTSSSESSLISFKKAWNDLDDDTKEDLLELAKAGELTPETLSSTEEYNKLLTQTGLTAEEVAKKINKMVTSSEQLASMGSGIKSLSNNLATKKENPKKAIDYDTLAGMSDELKENTKEWKKYEKVLGTASSTYEECRQATNKLATAFVNSNNFLAKLTDNNKDYYISQLKAMGIDNAEAVVKSVLNNKIEAQNNLEAAAKEAKVSLANATWDEISATNTYITATENAKVAMQKLYVQENILANNDLGINEKAAELQKFAKTILGAAVASQIAAKATSNMSKLNMGGWSTLDYQKAYNENYIKEFNKIFSKIKIDTPDVSVSPKNYSTSDSKSKNDKTKEKESTQIIDWIARRLEVLQNAIDLTKTKFENLYSLKKKKNNLTTQIKETTKLLNAQQKAIAKYQKKANNIKLSKSLKNKVKNGDITGSLSELIHTYGEKTANQIQNYRDYIDQISELRQSVQSTKQAIKELRDERDQLYVDDADAHLSKLDAYEELTSSAKVLNKYEEAKLKWVKQSYNYQIKIAKRENDTVKIAELRAEKEKEILEIKKQQLQNTLDENEAQRSYNNARIKNATSLAEKLKLGNANIDSYNDDISVRNSNKKDINKTIKNSSVISSKTTSSSTSSSTTSTTEKSSTTKTSSLKSVSVGTDLTSMLSYVSLTKAQKKKLSNLLKKRKEIPESLMKKVKKVSPKMYNKLVTYNNNVSDILKQIDEANKKKDTTITTASIKESLKKVSVSTDLTSKLSYIALTKTQKRKISNKLKNRKEIPESLLKAVKKVSPKMYEQLVQYNTQIQNILKDLPKAKAYEASILTDSQKKKKELNKISISTDITSRIASSGLTKAQKTKIGNYLKQRKVIPDSLMKKIKKASPSLYNKLLAYNNEVEDILAKYKSSSSTTSSSTTTATSQSDIDATISASNREYDTDNEETRAEKAQQALDNLSYIEEEYERIIEKFANAQSSLENKISILQANGGFATSNLFEAIADEEKKSRDALVKEEEALQKEFDAKIASGALVEGTDAWYEGLQKVQNISKMIEETDLNIANNMKQARDAAYELAKLRRDAIDILNAEAEFYQELLDSKDFFEENGTFNKYGQASLALSVSQAGYETQKIKEYQDSLADLEEQFKNGEIQYNEYNEKQLEYNQGIQDSIKTIYSQRDAIKDLVENAYDAQLDALNELIDKYIDALDREKDLRDYQNSIEEKTNNINSIKKQIAALTGNTTEEARAKLQKLQVQLRDAEKDLEDTQYDKYISDQKEILEDLSEDFENFISEQLKNIDILINELITNTKYNGASVAKTLNEFTSNFGVTISSSLQNALSGIDLSIDTARTVAENEEKNQSNNDVLSDTSGDTNSETDKVKDTLFEDIEKVLEEKQKEQESFTISKDSIDELNHLVAGGISSSNTITDTGTDINGTTGKGNSSNSDGIAVGLDTKIDKFLKENMRKPKNTTESQRISTDKLLQYLDKKYNQKGYLTSAKEAELAKMLGISVQDKKNITYNESVKIRDALKKAGFSQGGIAQFDSGILKKVGEDGIVLARNGEGFVRPEDVSKIKELMNNLPLVNNIMDNLVEVPYPGTLTKAVQPTTSVGDVNIHLDGSNIQDVDSFVKTIQTSKRVQRTLQEATIGMIRPNRINSTLEVKRH